MPSRGRKGRARAVALAAVGVGVAVVLGTAAGAGTVPAAGAAPDRGPRNPHDVARLDEAGCRVCHLPAREEPSPAPLWGSREAASPAPPAAEVVSAVGAGGVGAQSAPAAFGAEDASGPLDPVSHLCLSCHADDIAPAMAFRRAGTPSVFDAASTVDAAWPVERRPDEGAHAGRVWPDARPDLVPKEVAVASGLPLYGPLGDRIGCATCHAPHDTGEGVPLRIPNDRSRLCLTCHLK